MKWILPIAAVMSVVACGSGNPADPAGDAPESSVEASSNCAAIQKIVSARSDRPAFSSLGSDDIPDDALSCETVNSFVPSETWVAAEGPSSQDIVAHVCIYGESPSLDVESELRQTYALETTKFLDCLTEWEKSAVGGKSRDGVNVISAYQLFKMDDPGPTNPDGGNFTPVSFGWRLTNGVAGEPDGQRIVFYALAK